MKEQIEKMDVQALIDDLPPNVFADQVLRLFDVSGSSSPGDFWKQEYDEAVKEIGNLQDQLKDAESAIRDMESELRSRW